MKKIILCTIVSFFSFYIVLSQNFLEKVKDKDWTGTGTLMKRDAEFMMKWETVLFGKFYKLSFQNKIKDTNSAAFKAIGFYKIISDNKIEGTWFDSRGVTFPLKGKIDDDILSISWGSPETEEGETIYKYNNDNTITVEDYVKKNGEPVIFAKALYHN